MTSLIVTESNPIGIKRDFYVYELSHYVFLCVLYIWIVWDV